RAADRDGGSVPPDGGRHVLFRAWRQRFPEAGPGWAHHGHGLHPRPYRHHDGCRLRGARHVLPDVGALAACGLWGAGARAASEASAGRFGGDGRGPGMMAGHGEGLPAGGGPARHIPVMLGEVMAALRPRPGDTIVDGTFGAGGYTRAVLDAGATVVAIDRDPDAIAAGRPLAQASGGGLRLFHGPFSQLDALARGPAGGG